ncbi:acyltransferase family protein [Streptomyces albireticuli]|nr:acyltransferase [Streptomyces albireticuli]MCD9143027.1 acyltransferase [Streptomyces albireticuli]MCD9165270.1 acyltransferase [Streptomyces albireticuli]MCD9192212.1 acyltransferase [Streptomyces albireticuli]
MHSTLPVQHEQPGARTEPAAEAAPGADREPEPAGGASRHGRLGALDGLRLCAALMVVAYHYMAFGSGVWGRPSAEAFPLAHLPASYGWLGVQLFFLISGFVICMSCWGKGVGQFAASRVTRLFPAYWFAVLAVALAVHLWPPDGETPEPSDVAVNLTMLQSPLGVDPVDGVYWTLWIELRFYLLFALVVRKGLTYGRAVAFCVVWAVAAAVARAVDNPVLDQVLMPEDCWFFIAGIAFYLMHRFRPNLVLWLLVAGSFVIAQHYLLIAQGRAEGHMGHRVPQWPTVALMAFFFLAVMAVALGWTRRLEWRGLTAAGALTYPLYLIHERLGWMVIEHHAGRLPRHVLLPALVLAMLLAAWLVHRLVERPLARALGSGLRRAVTDIRSG